MGAISTAHGRPGTLPAQARQPNPASQSKPGSANPNSSGSGSSNPASRAGRNTATDTATIVDVEDDDSIPDLSAVARYTSASPANGAEIAAAWIGPEGGSVRLHDFEVVVPAGAVDRVTRFAIKIMPEPTRESHAWASFSPHNHAFNVPVTLRVPLQATESAGWADAHVIWWNQGTWEALPTTQTNDGRLETQTDHFSKYATQRRGITMVGG